MIAVSVIGSSVIFCTSRSSTSIFSVRYYLNSFYVGYANLILASLAANASGHTEKSATNSMVFVAYCAGNIVSSPLFKAQCHYRSSFVSIIICQVYAILAGQAVRNAHRDTIHRPQKTGQPFTGLADNNNNNNNNNFCYSF
ncbi:uncharacterized protein PV07_00923 [Cladophialophora immunda]|uniref:Uncharacterized protein n=1 Tax=Cladophialophora immunda TaxID=569365 RepID=A0A0D2B936_9EURO|nr:uncharacterized protein PV07_00923 [Cladophialophora immunda]KIW34127.1 hypothetical protein PV07_00923 [Cladophialophora immunda]